MRTFSHGWLMAALALASSFGAVSARAAEQVTLSNGFNVICDHREPAGNKVRLFLDGGNTNFVEVNAAEIASIENVPAPPPRTNDPDATEQKGQLTGPDLRQMLKQAGAEHDLNVDLLASVVRAESGGNAQAVSRAGAQGLMQLMPKTAARLGVRDSFAPEENIAGGTAYLDSLLKRYHGKLALALAAYNAGPAAVDHWHGIPPYPETRAYVARVIHEFNRLYAKREQHMLVAQVPR